MDSIGSDRCASRRACRVLPEIHEFRRSCRTSWVREVPSQRRSLGRHPIYARGCTAAVIPFGLLSAITDANGGATFPIAVPHDTPLLGLRLDCQ